MFWLTPNSPSNQDALQREIDLAHLMGLDTLVTLMPSPVRTLDGLSLAEISQVLSQATVDDYRRQADLLNQLGHQANKAGLQLAYHNFNSEFRPFEGVAAYDHLLEWTDPSLVKMELDCGWMVAGGADPVAYLKKYPGRFCALHIKDVAVSDPNFELHLQPIEVGSGVMRWLPILNAAVEARIPVGYVEYEPRKRLVRPLMESARVSIEFLKSTVS